MVTKGTATVRVTFQRIDLANLIGLVWNELKGKTELRGEDYSMVRTLLVLVKASRKKSQPTPKK